MSPETSGIDLIVFLVRQYQLRQPGGAAVRVQGLRGAGRGRRDGALLGPGLEQRHVLRSRFRNARPLRHHDPEGMGLGSAWAGGVCHTFISRCVQMLFWLLRFTFSA